MPYLDVAARQLGVSEKTLRKWLRQVEPPIEPTPHQRDRRYHVISDAEVERVRQALAERPGVQRGVAIPSYSSLAFDRRQSGEGTASDAAPVVAPAPRRPPLRSGVSVALPEGLVSLTAAAETHGVERFLSTFRHWRDEGKLDCDPGKYGGVRGQFAISRPLTRRGLAQLVALARGREGWRDCPLCPHEEDT